MENKDLGLEVLYEEFSKEELYSLYVEILNCYYKLIKSEEVVRELVEANGKRFHELNEDIKKQYLSFILFCERRIKPNGEVNIEDITSFDVESRIKEQKNYEVNKFEDAINNLREKEGLNIDPQDCQVALYKIYKDYDEIFYSYVDRENNDLERTF